MAGRGQEVLEMHPAGIQFGLSHGLLELNGGGTVLSPPFLERISEMARRFQCRHIPLLENKEGNNADSNSFTRSYARGHDLVAAARLNQFVHAG